MYETASPCIACVCSALPDGAPKHRLRRQRAQARRHHHGGQRPGGEYYLDLLVTDPGDHANIDPADYDPDLLQGLWDWEVDGWYPALAGGTSVPLFGDLRPGEDGTYRFTYYGLPRAFRIAVSGPDGAWATAEPFTRTVFYTHLTYDWETNSIIRATSRRGSTASSFYPPWCPP